MKATVSASETKATTVEGQDLQLLLGFCLLLGLAILFNKSFIHSPVTAHELLWGGIGWRQDAPHLHPVTGSGVDMGPNECRRCLSGGPGQSSPFHRPGMDLAMG